MYDNKYIVGLDIGISSVGWALLALDENDNPYRIIDVGSRIFTPGEEASGDSKAKARREKRGARRISRRREFRIDRVRNLLYENNYLKGNINEDNVVSEKNLELTKIFNDMITEYYKKNNTNPYILKTEALNRKLTDEELSIILVHYAKKRGYKSNREEGTNDKDAGKVLSAIKENEKIMKENHYETVSEMYVKDSKFKNKIKNGPDDYKVSVTREMYEDEINKVLDSQIKFGLIDNKFKEEYLNIWKSQRHYSEGPGYYYEYIDGKKEKLRSPYGGNLIERMVGKCIFDDNPRAPKRAPSSEIYVGLSKLINLRYKIDDKDYVSLTKEQIKEILELSKDKNEVKYSLISKVIGNDNIKFKSLQLSKREYIKVIDEFKKKLNIPKDKRIDINSLNSKEKELYDELYNKVLYSKSLFELNGYHELRKVFEKCYGKEEWDNVKDNIDMLDELARLCTNYKTNDDIKNGIENSIIIPNKYSDMEFIDKLPNFKDHLMLSTELIKKLIPIMLEGKRYDEAMEELNYSHSDIYGNKTKHDLLLPINSVSTIKNQRVIRSLSQTRKVLNAIIKKYGSPKIINIETAKELAKTKDERREIEKYQLERKEENDKTKQLLVELGIFTSIDKITSNDLLKYKLWKEQKECCGYSGKKIKIEELFDKNVVQIDHILPYSRTFNDNYLNKTLVFTKENQDKRERTPFEWFGNTDKWDKYESFINSLVIPIKKKDNYLMRNLDLDTARAMRDQNLNDTKYISKELASIIKAYLNVEKVNMYSGSLTAKLRARWGFNRLTHSYISKNYIMPSGMKEDIKKDRDNHLHHAMDALVIASITPSLEQKITLYEKFSRYIDGLTEKQLKNLTEQEIKEYDGTFYNDETGEIDDISFRKYVREEKIKEHITYGKHDIAKLEFPLPYEKFDDEAKIRVYEQNLDVLKWNLKAFNTYTNKDIENVRVLTPSLAKPKISGQMHEETYYGTVKDKEKKIILYKTLRTPLTKVKRKDLENIPDRLSGSKDIYYALVKWFGDKEKGEDALKAHNGKYPINPNDTEQKEIKKIKLYSPYKNTGHMVNGSNVEKGDIYQIDVLKSKDVNDDKLYFVAYDLFDLKKGNSKSKNVDFNIKVEYGRDKNYVIMSYKDMLDKYDVILKLNKNDLIKVRNKEGKQSVGYVTGFSTGKIEIKSLIGDGYDLFGENNLFEKQIDRFYITISTIKLIDKLSINLLGEISGL